MLTVDPHTRPVWLRLLLLSAVVVVAAALVLLLAPDARTDPNSSVHATGGRLLAQREPETHAGALLALPDLGEQQRAGQHTPGAEQGRIDEARAMGGEPIGHQ